MYRRTERSVRIRWTGLLFCVLQLDLSQWLNDINRIRIHMFIIESIVHTILNENKNGKQQTQIVNEC